MNKNETLKTALAARIEEIEHYQINIINYAAAMKKIEAQYTGNDPVSVAMQEFYKQLKNLHQSSIIEQTKAQLMHDVIKEQIKEDL